MSQQQKQADGGAGGAAAAMWSAWAQAQEQAMRRWAETLGATADPQPTPAAPWGGPWSQPWAMPWAPPFGASARPEVGLPGLDDFLATWQRLSREALERYLGQAGADPTARAAAEQMRGAQEAGFRLFGQVAEAWQRMAHQVEQGASWTSAAEAFGRNLQQGLASMTDGPAAWARTGAGAAELWRQYLAAVERSFGPWLSALRQDPMHAAGKTSPPASPLWDLGRMYWGAMDRVAEGMAASPRIGFGRETEELWIRGFDTWVDAMQAQLEYQRVLAECWTEAFAAALSELSRRAEAGEPVGSLRELAALWTSETDRVMEASLAGERYAAAQGAMVNAMMRHRKAEREIADALLAGSYLASKSELDEAYRAIAELRRTVRGLSERLAALEGDES